MFKGYWILDADELWQESRWIYKLRRAEKLQDFSCHALHLHLSQFRKPVTTSLSFECTPVFFQHWCSERIPDKVFPQMPPTCQVSHKSLYIYLFISSRTNGDAPPVSSKQPEEKDTNQFEGVDLQTEKLSHPTANRAKPPQRRPPSGLATAVSDRLIIVYLFYDSFGRSGNNVEVEGYIIEARSSGICWTIIVVLTTISTDDLWDWR